MIHPDFRAVMPLMPAPMVKPDGTAKNDGERQAAKRFMAKLRQDHPPLPCLITAESLRANAPHSATLHDEGCPDILGGTEGDHASWCKHVQAAEEAGRVTSSARQDRAAGVIHRFRLVHDVPLKASRADGRVNVLADGEMGPDQVQHCSGGTDWRRSKRHVSTRMRGGRARWKMANETCQTLKNQGDNFAHTDGHGEQNLSVVCAMLMMRAFVVDHTQQLCCAFFRAVGTKLGRKRWVWERLRALFEDDRLESRRAWLEALLYGCEKSRPLLMTDPS